MVRRADPHRSAKGPPAASSYDEVDESRAPSMRVILTVVDGPNAGKAFIDFFLEEESMKIQAATGEFVNRKGVHPPLPDADKIKFVQMYQFKKEDYEIKKKEYQKIFM